MVIMMVSGDSCGGDDGSVYHYHCNPYHHYLHNIVIAITTNNGNGTYSDDVGVNDGMSTITAVITIIIPVTIVIAITTMVIANVVVAGCKCLHDRLVVVMMV